MIIKEITSVQNQYVKELFLLKEKAKARKQSGLFLIEGQRELELALKGNYQIENILFLEDLITESELSNITNSQINIIKISKSVFQKLAHRNTTEGIIAVARSKNHDLENLKIDSKNSLILVAEAPEKPGNIGALLRTADAANIDAILIANVKGDLYNPNIIRSSIGCVFTTQIATSSTSQIIQFLKDENIAIYCAALQASIDYNTQDFTKATALIVGTESTGLSEEWLKNSTQNIVIPMQGEIDSMNVSVAAGILIFEAKRQRNFK